jgi:hypothetical protein
VSRTFGDVDRSFGPYAWHPVGDLWARMCVIGMHTLFDGVCRPGCHCTRMGVFLVNQEDFPLDPACFRVAAGWWKSLGMHTLFDEVCRPGCRCTHAEVFLVDQEDFPLDPVSFRVVDG